MHRRTRLFYSFWLLVLTLLPTLAMAGILDSYTGSGDKPLKVDKAYQLEVRQDTPGVVTLVWTIAPDYYLYRDRMEFKTSDGVKLVDRRNAPAEVKDDPLFGRVFVYHDHAQVDLLLGSEVEGSREGTLKISYQGCWEKGICYPPVTREIPLTDLPSANELNWPESVTDQPKAKAATDNISSSFGNALSAVQEGQQGFFTQLFVSQPLWFVLLAFFVVGIALAFTPCVFPMIPILSGIIAGQGARISTLHAFTLSLVYVLAMAVTYTMAGVIVGSFGANLQMLFQSVWVIGLFSLLFVLLALSMFGFYELQMPAALQTRLSGLSNRQRSGSYTGVAIMGMLSALIVGPCMAAPLAGALLYIGQQGDPVLGGAALFMLALGMGVPLLLIGTSAGRLLPRAGVWMEAVKRAFGVILLLLAITMLDRIVDPAVTMVLTGITLIVTAVYMNAVDRLPPRANGWLRLWKGVGIVMLIYGAVLLLGVFSGSRSMIYPLSNVLSTSSAKVQEGRSLDFIRVTDESGLDRQLAAAKAAGQPVMLDFYADWCVSCKELEVTTFADSAVQERLSAFRVIKVDVTANDAAAKALNKRFNLYGPPALIFYDRAGVEQPQMQMIGVVEPSRFLNRIADL